MNVIRSLLLTALIAACGVAHAETAFTYQGRLGSAGQPAHGPHDFRFRLFDDASAGGQVGVEQAVPSVDVDAGIFTVQLDFGDGPFNVAPRWLEIAVRETGASAYTTLAPRQRIGAAPFAIETMFVAPGAVDTAALQDGAITSNKIANGAVQPQHVASNSIDGGHVADGSLDPSDLGFALYTSRTQLQVYTATEAFTGAFGVAVAACPDANDLPIAADCPPGTGSDDVTLQGFTLLNWSSTTQPASVVCEARQTSSNTTDTVRARIHCLDVP